MKTNANKASRLNFRLPNELKAVIEQAAASLGQSVSDFAVATLVQTARNVILQRSVTELTNRDRDLFIAMLDDADAMPNKALRDAAKRYRKHFG